MDTLATLPLLLRQKCRLNPELPIVVGVSGGPDSLCLLHLLFSQGYRVIVAHFNHCLRAEAEEDARFVANLAQEWDLPFVQEAANVHAFAREQHLSLEEAARQLRYRFLFATAERFQAQAVAVAHTANDQIETVLLNFLRGSGLRGLGGMDYVTFLTAFSPRIPLVRPLLGIWRDEVEAYCREHGLTPRRDLSNTSLRFRRNRIRLELLPLLESYNPRLREHLWQMSRLLREDWQILSESIETLWTKILLEKGEGFLTLDEFSLRAQPLALRRYLLRHAIETLSGRPRDVSLKTLERATQWIESKSPRLKLNAEFTLQRWQGQIYLLASESGWLSLWPQLPSEQPLEIPDEGEITLAGDWRLSVQRERDAQMALQKARSNTHPYQAWIDISGLPLPLLLRPPQRGDRFAPFGMGGHTLKLSDLFINVKIPSPVRIRWPLLCAGDEILWVVGLRLSERARLRPESQMVIHLSLYQNNPKS